MNVGRPGDAKCLRQQRGRRSQLLLAVVKRLGQRPALGKLAQGDLALGDTRSAGTDHDGESVGAKALDGIVNRRPNLAQRGQGELIVATAVAQGKFVETWQWHSRFDSTERQRAAG